MDSFLSRHETYLISTCINPDSEYMWKEYAGDNGYKIVLDKRKLVFDISANNKKRDDVFRCGEILYDKNEQLEVLTKEYQELMASEDSVDEYNMELVLKHIMFVGNFYKCDKNEFKQEEEYRILINILKHGDKDLECDSLLPERKYNPINNKHYVEIDFPKEAIKKIVCASEQAKKSLENEITDIKIELRKK